MEKAILNVLDFSKDITKIILVNDTVPDCLYHYTTIQGFKGIIESGEIWATAAHCLFTDPTEITFVRKLALETLKEREQDFEKKKELYNICKKIIEDWSNNKDSVFVCSFTEKKDLLSQWRAYCPKGGVSIGFSIPKISKNNQSFSIKNDNHVDYYVHEDYLYKCIYAPQEQKQKINNLFNLLLSPKYANISKDIAHAPIWNALRFFSYSFKHLSFEEEQEWRLCVFHFGTEYETAKPEYRVKDSMLIPYLPFLTVDNEGNSIIRSIKIGPSRDKETLKTNILSYLKDKGHKDVIVSITETPYQNL